MTTVLEELQRVALRIGVAQPQAAFGTDDRDAMELGDMANEAAEYIAKSYDWQRLTVKKDFTGDGTTTSYSIPSDYDRLIVDAQMHSSITRMPLTHLTSSDAWLKQEVNAWTPEWKTWIIVENQFQFYPALDSGETASIYFISKNFARDNIGTAKTLFNADDDEFRLDNRLLRLCTVWMWKEKKGQPYAEDMRTFELALEQEITRNRGPRGFHIGRPSFMRGVRVAYPYPIVP